MAEAILRVILGGEGVIHRLPDAGGRIKIKAWQDQRPLWQGCDLLHQQGGGATRASGARDQHRVLRRGALPALGKLLHGEALARFGIGGIAEQWGYDPQEGLGSFPVFGMG